MGKVDDAGTEQDAGAGLDHGRRRDFEPAKDREEAELELRIVVRVGERPHDVLLSESRVVVVVSLNAL